jgi:hypothetical protein
MREIIRRGVVPIAIAAAIACSVAATPVARADAGQGAIRLGVDVPVFGLNDFPDANPNLVMQLGPLGNPLSGAGFVNPFGVAIVSPIPMVAASFGYQVTDALVIGARAGFGIALVHTELPPGVGGDPDLNVGALSFLPYVEYLFLSGNVRPFVGGQAGFQVIFPDTLDAQGTFIGGALGGVHIFATPSFSISPYANLDFVYRGADENAGFDLILGASFEGWIN